MEFAQPARTEALVAQSTGGTAAGVAAAEAGTSPQAHPHGAEARENKGFASAADDSMAFCLNSSLARAGRMSLAASCASSIPLMEYPSLLASVQQGFSAMGLLALLGLVKPGMETHQRRQRSRSQAQNAGQSSRSPRENRRGRQRRQTANDRCNRKLPPVPPVFSYEELLAKYKAAKLSEGLSSESSQPLPEYYPSCRPDLLPLRCRTGYYQDPNEDKLKIMVSWLAAAAREIGREDLPSEQSVLNTVWEHRALPMLRRLAKLRQMRAAESQGIRRTHRATAWKGEDGDGDDSTSHLDGLSTPRQHSSMRGRIDEGPLSPASMSGRGSSSESRLGMQYQARVPKPTARPHSMTELEKSWLQSAMDLKGMIAQPDGQLPHNRESLMQLVESHDPEAARAIGLADAGSGGMEGWGKTEIELFRLGLETLGRSFRHIAMVLQVSSECKQHGPDQTVALGKALFRKIAENPRDRSMPPASRDWLHKVVAFYYNVWKLKGCEEARNWYDAGCPLGMLMGKPGEVTFKQPQDENRAEADPATQPKRLDGAASMYPETRTVLNSHRAAAAAAAFGLEPDTDMIPSMISSGRDQGPGRKADHSSSAADHVEGMHAVSPDQGSNSGGSIPETQPGSQAAQTGDRPTLLHAQVSHATIAGHSTTNVSPSLPAASAHIKPIEPIAGGPQLLPAPTVQREQIVFGQLQHQAVTQPAGLGKRPSSVLDANNIAEPVKAARTVDLTSQNPVAPN